MLHQSVFLAAALPVLSHATLLRGVDVSHYQGIVDWAKVASVPGMTFACVKATEGTSYVDAQFGAKDHLGSDRVHEKMLISAK